MSLVTPTTLASFERDVIDASRREPVLVDFWAAWCGPCRNLAPILENVARTLAGRARVVKVDTDAEQALAARYQIRGIPTVMLFRDGKVASQFTGVQPEQAIRDWVQPFLAEVPATPVAEGPEVLAEKALDAGDLEAARRHLADVPDDRAGSGQVARLHDRLTFATELTAVAAGNSDLDALYADGLKAAIAGAHERAADAFLNLTIRSRAYREDAGRLALLRLFEMLGPGDPLARDYRRRLSQALH